MNGQVKYAITNYLTPDNKINEFHFYYPDGFTKKDSIVKLISDGLSFINYSGHGTSAGWLHVDIKSPDVKNFSNRSMYPFVISNACRTAQFNAFSSWQNGTAHGRAIRIYQLYQ
jgi:gingipain K